MQQWFTELEGETATQTLRAPHAFESTGKEGGDCMAGVTDPGYGGKTELLLHNGRKEEYV